MFIIERVPSQFSPEDEILALGTDTQPKISWSRKGEIFSLSPREKTCPLDEFFFKAPAYAKRRFRLAPRLIAFDPHPLFVCGEAAAVLKKTIFPAAALRPVFHHIAHVARFAIEAGLRKKFIGIAFDGTGFGEDRRAWGGEFFIYDQTFFRRVAHFEEQLLLGNEAAIREPWRIALAVLYKIYSKKLLKMDLGFLSRIPRAKVDLLLEVFEKRFNTAETSSVGRLFDAVAALTGVKSVVSREAEAAVALEKAARRFKGCVSAYPFKIKRRKDVSVIDVGPLFRHIVSDLKESKGAAEIAKKFHVTLAAVVRQMCGQLKKKYGIDRVYLSGGVFMNEILREEAGRVLRKDRFDVAFAEKPATTDLGISEGQIAACVMEKKVYPAA